MHRQPSEETARGKGGLSHLTESTGILQQYLQVAPWASGALGLWSSLPVGGEQSQLVNGMPDLGGLIAGNRTAGTWQSLPGPGGCSKGAEWEPKGREVSDLFAKNSSRIHPRAPFSWAGALQHPSS